MRPALLLAAAAWLAWPPALTPLIHPSAPEAGATSRPRQGLVERFRPLWAACGLLAGTTLVGGVAGVVLGAVAAGAVWAAIGRAEPAAAARHRREVRRDLPHLVDLVALGLDSGAAVTTALELAAAAVPGAAADALRETSARLRVGTAAHDAWAVPPGDPLAPLARAMVRAHSAGGSVSRAAHQLADELVEQVAADLETRARTVGVRAALPLGLCLLPAFVLLGIVPMVVGAVGAIAW